MRRWPAAVATLLAASLAFGGCSDGERAADTPRATTPTSIPIDVAGRVDLRRLVVADDPPGYDRLSSPPFGAVDLARLLEEFSDAPVEDKAILEETGFETGYTRGWQREEPRSFLGVFVFEFADEEGARAARDRFAAQNVATKQAERFPVDGIVGAIGESYTQRPADEPPERVHVVTFVRGPRLYQVGGQFADEAATVEETVAFATLEARLAA